MPLTFYFNMGYYFLLVHCKINHKWVYNIFIPIETTCILYVLYRGAIQLLIRQVNLILLGVLPVALAVIYWVYGHFWAYNGAAAGWVGKYP